MENFQLYRTNVLLGGNMKYDLILNSDNNELYVSDFHITPISDKLPYNKYTDDDLLNFAHYENIRKYYEEIQGRFYEEYIDPQLMSDWPIIESDNSTKQYDDTFLMGCKRSQYELYNKQFEFLCPIWLEKVKDDDEIKFNIIVSSINDQEIGRKSLRLNFNDKFGKYIKEYISYLGLNDGDDDIMFVDFNSKYATIKGLEINSGNLITKDVSNIIDNLLYRERPLMEFDYILINSFMNNKIIAKQLFNFNLCFNINDILGGFVNNMLISHQLNVKVNIEVGGELLRLKDFYTNYETLEKEEYNIISIKDIIEPKENDSDKEGDSIDENKLVLNYLKDYRSIDLINKNKISQKYIHWALKNNSKYIFNAYGGFSGMLYDDGNNLIKEYDHYYGVITDIINKDGEGDFVPWINTISATNGDLVHLKELEKYSTSRYSNVYSKLQQFVNNVKYNYDSDLDLQVLMIYTYNDVSSKDDFFETIKTVYNKYSSYKDENNNDEVIFIHITKKILWIVSNNYKYLTFKSIKTILYNLLNGEDKINGETLKELYNFINTIEPFTIISFQRGLKWFPVEGPSSMVKEIQYYKDDNKSQYLVRYDGYIKPMFIESGNELYYKDIMGRDDIKYKKYLKYNFPPLYPSIDYYPIKRIQLNYNTLNSDINNIFEYKWFNSNLIYNLPVQIDLSGEYGEDIDGIIDDYFKNNYNEDVKNDIQKLYNISYDLLNISGDKYNYNIQLNLK